MTMKQRDMMLDALRAHRAKVLSEMGRDIFNDMGRGKPLEWRYEDWERYLDEIDAAIMRLAP